MKYTDEFEIFWKKYPKRWSRDSGLYIKRKKQPAFIKWQRLSQEIRNECLVKVKYVRNAEGGASGVRDAVTWLNQEGWDEIELPDKPKPKDLPAEITPNLKQIPSTTVNISNERNKQLKALSRN